MVVAKRLDNLKPSYIRTILHAATAPGMISLAGGLPSQHVLPVQILQQTLTQLADQPSTLQYGSTEGEPELRQWVANTMNIEDSQVLITSGAQQALDLVIRSLVDEGDTVVVEAPSYLGVLQIFQLARATIITVAQKEQGPDLDQLERVFSKQRPIVFYAVADFHNPTGCCWSLPVRRHVVALARRYGVTLIEDAPYRSLRYSGDDLPCLYQLAPDTVLHIGSFSKTVAPGLRLGYLCADSGVNDFARVKQAVDLHSSTLTQRVLVAMLTSGFYQQHLSKLKQHYRQRCDALALALRCEFNETIDFMLPEGGMFIWATLSDVSAAALAERGLANGVAIVPGDVFYDDSVSTDQQCIRLNFTHGDPASLKEGVRRLKQSFDQLLI